MRFSWLVVGLVVASLSLLSGCASRMPPRSDSAASSAAGRSFTYLGPVSVPATLDEGDILLGVPPVGDAPKVSPSAAFGACEHGAGACRTSARATIRLALVTTLAAGTAGPSGTIKPRIDHALTYVVEYSGYECVPVGGLFSPSASTAQVSVRQACQMHDFVSAVDGSDRYAFDGPISQN